MIEPIKSTRYVIDEKRLETINELLNLCVEFSLDTNFKLIENWLITLRTLNREVSFFYSEEERKKVEGVFEKINTIRNKKNKETEDKTNYYKLIEELDTLLKKILHDHKILFGSMK